MSEKVVVGMSGGVDSSVCAYILKKKGYDVIGVTLNMFNPEDIADYKGCNDSVESAKKVCDSIGIPHHSFDISNDFKCNVIDYFIDEYKNCRTPNPCIACNKTIKWGKLLSIGKELGADKIATGHYARICTLENGRVGIKIPSDKRKDQSYFLYRLSQDELSSTLFPLADLSKEDIRGIAREINLPVAERKDSQDVCFISGSNPEFVSNYISDMGPGDFVDTDGSVLGQHKGIYRYTYGQRKNLGIALGERMYVKRLDLKNNRVVLSRDDELYTDRLYAGDINYMGESSFDPDKEYIGKIRYSHSGTPCSIETLDNGILVKFKEPVRAVTPGQAVVIYNDEVVMGGGIISDTQ